MDPTHVSFPYSNPGHPPVGDREPASLCYNHAQIALPFFLSCPSPPQLGSAHLFECGFYQVGWKHVPGKKREAETEEFQCQERRSLGVGSSEHTIGSGQWNLL